MTEKRLAILIHGESYCEPASIPIPTATKETMDIIDNYCSRCKCKPTTAWPPELCDELKNRTFCLDWRQSIVSFKENIVDVFKSIYNIIDIYVVTYDHPHIEQLMLDFNPKTKQILPERCDSLTMGLKMIKDISGNVVYKGISGYNHILAVQFDNYYPVKFPIDRLNMDDVNVPWKELDGSVNNCFLFLNYSRLSDVINKDYTNINYLCERSLLKQEFYPDFVFPQKRLKDFVTHKLQPVEISSKGGVNWCMTMTVSKHIVIITSCINTDASPLCYYPCRSLFTPEERMEHTLVSIATVREKIPNVIIILMNNNELTHQQHSILTNLCDYVFIFDSVKLNDVVITADLARTFPNKSCSETASLYYACERIQQMNLSYDYLWKLSGRSYLRPEFNIEDWPPFDDKITTPPKGYGINNTLYNIPKAMVPYYMERLKYCCLECYYDPQGEHNSMVEWKLFDVAYNPNSTTHYFLPCLAQIAGICTVDSSHTHWAR